MRWREIARIYNSIDGKKMTYQDWENTLPKEIKNDPLWTFYVYPKALFLSDICWHDCEKLLKDVRGKAIANQLIRSAGSICANIEEGYGRGYGRDYARFLTIALGSARETKGWYYRGRHLINNDALNHRLELLEEIISLLVVHIQKQRNQKA